MLLILKLPTIKKAVKLLTSIGVLKLTAINLKNTNVMKKMLFGLIATVIMSVSGNAQTNEEVLKVYQENRPMFAKLMLGFTNNLKESYYKGMTFESFVNKTTTAKELSVDGRIILKKSFTYIKEGTSSEVILNNETGYEIAVAFLNYSKLKGDQSFEDYLFGQSNSKAKGFWASLWQGIKDAVSWIWENKEEIISFYVRCCDLKICCK